FPVPSYPETYAVPVKAINHERTVCAGGQINSTNGCYAGYYDHMLPLCYPSHTCNKYNPIKPIGYPPKVIPTLPPPPIENSTRLVYDNYYGAGYVQGKENAIADRQLNYTTPDDACLYPDPPYVSYCKGYHVAYDFNWNTRWSQIHPIKPAIDSRDETIFSNIGIVLNNLGNHTGAILYFDKVLAIDPKYVLALTDKGWTLNGLGNYTGAITYLDKALAIQPNDTYALDNKGAALNNLGNHTGAIEYFDKVLAIDPHNVPALGNKGAALDNLGNHTGAILYFDKALAIDPKNTYALDSKAAILDRLGSYTTFR
ncbi:MAG: tetratricopeptide repeat protein, partial [Candidatus Nitrosopolaris sp.]